MSITSTTPSGRIRDVFDEYSWEMSGTDRMELADMIVCFDEDEPWLLVEISIYDGSPFYTFHESRDDAYRYHAGQEYPNDWRFECVVDLNTGKRFTPAETKVVTWEQT